MEMTLLITVQLICDQADYLLNVCMPIFEIFLIVADRRDFPHSGRPHTAQTPDNVQLINNLIFADKRVTMNVLSLQVGVGEVSVCRILKQLELKRFVPGGFRGC